jgi:chromosomal replication initiator protein
MDDLFSQSGTNEFQRLAEAWDGMLQQICPEIPPAWYDRFVRPLSPISLVGGVAKVNAPGRFVFDWVRDRYASQIQSMLSDELGFQIELELNCAPNERNLAERAEPVPVHAAFEPNAYKPKDKFSFESFVPGASNRFALAGAKAVAADPGRNYNPLFIYGQPGLGKTHLMHAIGREIHKRDPKFSVAFMGAQEFTEQFIQALQTNRMDHFRRAQRNVGIWLLDDVQFIVGRDKTQEEIFHTFNYLQSLGKQIVLTSDRPPRDLHLMDERLRSRFECGLVADVQMPDTETRCAILLSKATQERVELAVEVAMFLAARVPGNIRTLEGALNKLVVLASLDRRPLSMEVAEEVYEKYYRSGIMEKPGVNQIVAAVGEHFKISPDEIRSTSRKAPIVQARHVAVYITREITQDSWKHIGSQFGDRDHTSMMHGYQRISEQIRSDNDLNSVVKALMSKLNLGR